MKILATVIFVVLIVAVLALCSISFQVRETESVVVTRFGRPQRPLTEPGFYWKWAWPIERVHSFDSRLRYYEGVIEETTTMGSQPIVVTSYVVWKIAAPQVFLESVGTVKAAEDHLYGQLRDVQNKVIGQHSFSEFVNTDPAKIRFALIENEMADTLRGQMEGAYGIAIETVGLKQLGVSEKVTEAVFSRMRSDRKAIADAIIEQGRADEVKIKTEADTKQKKLLAAAEARAKAIRGAGDAEAAKYYELLKADEELAMFLRDIESMKKILAERSTVVLSGETEPFDLLKGMPSISPK